MDGRASVPIPMAVPDSDDVMKRKKNLLWLKSLNCGQLGRLIVRTVRPGRDFESKATILSIVSEVLGSLP